MEIRYARPDDFGHIEALALDFIGESGYPFEIDHTKFRNFIWGFILAHGNKKACIVMADKNNVPVGMVAGSVSELYYTSAKIAQEIVWYVDQDYRGIRNSLELLDAYEAWAQWQGCQYVQVSNIQALEGDKVEKFYYRKGYEKKESAFLKELT